LWGGDGVFPKGTVGNKTAGVAPLGILLGESRRQTWSLQIKKKNKAVVNNSELQGGSMFKTRLSRRRGVGVGAKVSRDHGKFLSKGAYSELPGGFRLNDNAVDTAAGMVWGEKRKAPLWGGQQ